MSKITMIEPYVEVLGQWFFGQLMVQWFSPAGFNIYI